MRRTTRLSLSLLAAIILALTIYAYPSWAGFSTLLFRAGAILAVLTIATVIGAGLSRRRPGRFDLIIALTAIGVVIASWAQISASADANRLAGEITDSGEENVLVVLAATETNTGSLVRAGVELRNGTNSEIELLFAPLWREDFANAIGGPAAEDADQLAAASENIAALAAAVDEIRVTIDQMLDDEIEAIAAIETALPDSARLSFAATARDEVEGDREIFHARVDLAAARLDVAARIITLLQVNPGGYRYDPAAEALAFLAGGAILTATADSYLAMMANIEATWIEEGQLTAGQDARWMESVLALIEAASATP